MYFPTCFLYRCGGLADTSAPFTENPLYGVAEFRGGFSEPEDAPAPPAAHSASTSSPVSTPTSKPAADVTPEHEISAEGYSILQKGLFLAVILGCVVVYLRMSSKKDRRYREKSMV
jgi:hypothetical protein